MIRSGPSWTSPGQEASRVFSLTGSTIPSGNGVLVDVTFSGAPEDLCLDGVVFSDANGQPIEIEIGDCYSVVSGCTDSAACNYNADAEEDDGSCAYIEDCAGECGGDATEDCAGECGGDAVVDGCDVCDGDNSSCDVPAEFVYEQSTDQAYYYFYTATIDGDLLEAEDWVGAFNGDICVGSRNWNTEYCGGGVCDVPVMGDDVYTWTEGYMQEGGIPSFKIFDASENTYYDAVASEEIPWEPTQLFLINNLNVGADCAGDLNGTAFEDSCGECSGGNSGHVAGSDIDCNGDCFGEALVDSCDQCSGGESGHVAGSDIDCNGDCFGVALDDSCGLCSGGNSGHEADSDQDDCSVCFGINVAGSGDINADSQLDVNDIVLMVNHVIDDSYSFESCGLIVGDVNSDSVIDILDIIVVIETIVYGDLARTDEILKAAPSTLELLQRSNSLGYVTDKPGLIGFELILSHENDFSIVLNEESFIGDYNTSGNETKIIIVLAGGRELFTTTGKFEIEDMMICTANGVLLDVAITIIPDEYTLERAYPNPFNPVTTLSFAIPIDAEVSLSIYNLQGREVSTLISGYMDAGYHSVVWNADSHASGVYFVNMVAGEYISTQKLMLVK